MCIKKLSFALLFTLVLFQTAVQAQDCGCPDIKANNYNSSVHCNDGSCTYNDTVVTPTDAINLPTVMRETSGLTFWNDKLWTHNDNDDTNLYAFAANSPASYNTYQLTGTSNIEWEEIAQDENNIYLGDFGNNASGNRTNLRILRINKNSILGNTPQVETINFSYETQTDFTAQPNNSTDFDCEAFVVSDDSIYLFTKEWVSKKTSLFVLPNTPGTFQAKYKDSYNVDGLITGATYLKNKNLAVLTGYTEQLTPFLVLLYDFEKGDFLGANKRRINLNNSFHQVEGINTIDGLHYHITNESFSKSIINIPAKIQTLDLTAFLDSYLSITNFDNTLTNNALQAKVYPNPAKDAINIEIPNDKQLLNISIFNALGELLGIYKLNNECLTLPVDKFVDGIYYYSTNDSRQNYYSGKFIIR